MAIKSPSLIEFLRRLEEVESLWKLSKDLEKSAKPEDLANASYICRGSIVLLSGHLEAYVRDLVEQALISLHTNSLDRSLIQPHTLFYFSQDHVKELKETNDPEKIARKILYFLSSEAKHWKREGVVEEEFPYENFAKGFSNPTFDKISGYFARLGYSCFEADLKRKMKGEFLTLRNSVDTLVDLRNKIAHGDHSASRTPGEFKQLLKLIKIFPYEVIRLFVGGGKKTTVILLQVVEFEPRLQVSRFRLQP